MASLILDNPSLQPIFADAVSFISRLRIINKDGKLVYLNLNEEQLRILEELQTGDDFLECKARQIGSSTIVAAYIFWRIYTSKEPVTAAILSHKLQSSKHLLKMHKIFYDNLPTILKRPLSVDNTIELRFSDTGAGIIAVSAGADGGLRSFTCSYLHISEYAFAPNPEELKATAISALNNGQLIIESTANYFNDALHQEIMKYERGEARWRYLFFPWFTHSEYSEEIPEEESPSIEWTDVETELMRKYELTVEQLWWRRNKIGKLGKDKFTREYPACLEDAYAMTGNTYLRPTDFDDIDIIPVDPVELVYLSKPDPDDAYALGVDVAAGVRRDYSVIHVISKKTHQVVATYRSNEVVPVVLATRIIDLATEYNNAIVLVESNNYGNVVLNEMRHQGYTNIWLDDGKDWQTNIKTKTEMFENLKSMIQDGYIQFLDNITYSELRALQVNEKGHIIIPEQMESHGDNAVALALGYMALKKVKIKAVPFLPSFIKHNRVNRTVQSAGVNIAGKRRY